MGFVRVSGYNQTDMNNRYQEGYDTGYNAGITYADGRSNPSSTNYQTGYNAGIIYADNRVNTSSASYTRGYSNGDTAGYNRKTQENTTAKGGRSLSWSPTLGQSITFYLNGQFSSFSSVYITWRWMTTAASGMESARYKWCANDGGRDHVPITTVARAVSDGVLVLSGRDMSGNVVSVNTSNLSNLSYITMAASNGIYGTWNMESYSYSVTIV